MPQGAGFPNIVEFTTYLVHSQDIGKFTQYRAREYPRLFPDGGYPTNTLLIALATARQLSEATAAHSLGAVLGLGEVDEDELYAALDLLGPNQTGVEKVLAQRHLEDGVLVLYDVTSSYLEGRRCELAQFGYSRDHRRDRPLIVFGLLCTLEGCPVAVEVFEGNLGDPSTLGDEQELRRPTPCSASPIVSTPDSAGRTPLKPRSARLAPMPTGR